jgi:hypothetical protein
MSRHVLRGSTGFLAVLMLAAGGPALAQSATDADLVSLRQQALTCQIGTPECEAIRDQVMLKLSEQVEFCTDSSCDEARMQLAEQIQLRECDPAVLDCTLLQQKIMSEAALPASGLEGGISAPAGAIQPGPGPDMDIGADAPPVAN